MFSNIFEGSVTLQNVAMAISYSQDCQIPLDYAIWHIQDIVKEMILLNS